MIAMVRNSEFRKVSCKVCSAVVLLFFCLCLVFLLTLLCMISDQ